MQVCPKCNSSNITKRGTRNEKQIYQCNDCRGYFSVSLKSNSEIPDGYIVKGQSTLYDENGKVKLTWEKVDRDKSQQFEMAKKAIEELSKDIPKVQPQEFTGTSKGELAVVIPFGDPHIGLYTWSEEVGEDYTLAKAKDLFIKGMQQSVYQAPNADRCYIINVGDFFHADNMDNKTSRSGHALDVDGRYQQILKVGIEIFRSWINTCLVKYPEVHIINAVGNHDDHSSQWLNVALQAMYEIEPRVTVKDNASKYIYEQFGKVLFGVTHGDGAKMADLGEIMACDVPNEWGQSRHRYWYTGHLHHEQIKEFRGVRTETFRTLAKGDNWHNGAGYRSDRDIKVIVLHKDFGEVQRLTLNIEQFKSS